MRMDQFFTIAEPEILADDGYGAPVDSGAASPVRGGLDRGLILHKLIEEVLTGEMAETVEHYRVQVRTYPDTTGTDQA